MQKKYKIAFIVPRYACGKAGGAEIHCQQLAEKVVLRGHQVSVLTSAAQDHFSWKNHFLSRKETINSVKVYRFKVNKDRDVKKFLSLRKRIDNHEELSLKEEQEWTKNDVNSRDLEDFIKKNGNDYDCFIFMPYLFGITYSSHLICPEKSLLIPCLHDENFAYLKIFKNMFNNFKGIMFNTSPEIDLAKKIYNLPPEKITLVSLGFTQPLIIKAQNFTKKYKTDYPFILFVGRRELGKNIPILLSYFRTYKKNNSNNLKLLFLGTGDLNLKPEDKDYIIDLGYVSEEDKINATAAALSLCQPSINESLSIVVMEAWSSNTAVLAHADCAVTYDHCLKSNGGLYFKNYYEFEGCLNFLLNNPAQTKKMGLNGKKYVEKNFNWDVVIERFENALAKFIG